MLKASEVKIIADIANNNLGGTGTPLSVNDCEILKRFFTTVVDVARAHCYDCNFKTSEPMSASLLRVIENLGYTIYLEGFTYKVSWSHPK